MKPYIRILLLLFFVEYSSAQNKLDSLNRLIEKATSDTQRINLTIEKIHLLENSDLDAAIILGNKTVEEAKAIGYRKGEASARSMMSYANYYKGDYARAKENLDIAKKIFSDIKDSIGFAKVLNGYGIMYSMQNKYDSALIFYEQATAIQQLQTDLGLLSTIYENMGIAYQQQSNYPQALVYYQKALFTAEKQNDEVSQAYIILNMANTFNVLSDTLRAEQSFVKALNLAIKLNLKMVETYAYSNLSSLYGSMNNPGKEYEFGMKAAALAKDIGDLGIEASSLSRAALALATQNKFEDAEKLSLRSLSIAESSKQNLNIYQTSTVMGTILKNQKKYRQAIPYYQKALTALTDADLYDGQVADTYLSFSECYENTGNYDKAITAFKTATRINDSIRNKDNIRKATELTLNAEFDKKQQIAKAEQQKKDEVAKTKQTALIIGLALTFILALVAFNGFRNKRKSNFLLQKQKEEIQKTLKELKITQAQLVQSEKMASLGELTAGIAHEIQNPLNFVNNFSDINSELIEEANTEMERGNIREAQLILNNVKDNQEKINHHGKRADLIVKGMLLHSRSGNGIKQPAYINKLAEEYLRLSYHGMRAKDKTFNVTMKTHFDDTIGKTNIVSQDIGRVLLNLYNNAFYALAEKKNQQPGNYEPTISISTKKVGDKVQVNVKDNGDGIPPNIIDKIFQPFFTTKPTGQGTGLGLSLAYDIVKAHGGEMKVTSESKEFTEFTILLPC